MKPNLRAIAARSLLEPANAHTFGDVNPGPSPTEVALQRLGTRLAAELDDAIIEALGRHLKRPISGRAELQQLALRMEQKTDPDRPEAGETYAIDGVDILWAGQIHVEQDGTKLRAGRDIRQLLEALEY
ncbi:MAG TPA: hypothetical protein VD932_05455 [Aquabacterium sp.]|nr:hypothetical protein [Aquabacterium sp.]